MLSHAGSKMLAYMDKKLCGLRHSDPQETAVYCALAQAGSLARADTPLPADAAHSYALLA